jgi:hypothetical protein
MKFFSKGAVATWWLRSMYNPEPPGRYRSRVPHVNPAGVPDESSVGSDEAGDRFRKTSGAKRLGRPAGRRFALPSLQVAR